MKKLLTLLFLTGSLFCKGQNYQCLQSGLKHYFINASGYLRGIRIDSAKSSGSDSVFYPFKTARTSTYPLDTTQGSWLGSHVMQIADGTFLFNTIWNDTVVIKTQANPGDSWVFYNDTSRRYYIATLASADTMSLPGGVDSIKRIRINSYTGGILNTADSINNFEIILSKNNGFARVFDLYTFPYHDPNTSVYSPGVDRYLDEICSRSGGQLTSLSSVFSLFGYQNPVKTDISNFSVGDAFYSYTNTYETSTYYTTLDEYIYDSVISKNIPDAYHVDYQIYEWINTTNYYYPGTTAAPVNSSYTHTVTVTEDTSTVINLAAVPEEITHGDTIYFYNPSDSTRCYTSESYVVGLLPAFERCDYSIGYKAGFGQASATFSGFLPGNFIGCSTITNTSLLFSIKNGVFCGTHPMPPNGVKEITISNNYTLYPNPAANELTIKTNNTLPYTITLINMLGQAATTIHTIKAQETINVANIPAGVYNVTITDAGGNRYNEK